MLQLTQCLRRYPGQGPGRTSLSPALYLQATPGRTGPPFSHLKPTLDQQGILNVQQMPRLAWWGSGVVVVTGTSISAKKCWKSVSTTLVMSLLSATSLCRGMTSVCL